MRTMSRRDILSSSGVAFAVPLAASLGPVAALAPTDMRAQSQNLGAALIPASADFADYSARAIITNMHLHSTGNLDKAGTATLSRQLTFFADHLENTGFDAAFKNYCEDPNNIAAMPLYTDQTAKAQQMLSQYVPSITPDMYPIQPGQTVGAANVATGCAFIAQNGISYILRIHADYLRHSVPALASTVSVSRKHPQASVVYPVYTPEKPAHLLHTSCNSVISGLISGWNNMSRADQCTLLESTVAALGGAVSAAVCALALTGVAAVLCALGFALYCILLGVIFTLQCHAS